MMASLPFDLLDVILGHIESRADILNVALSNKALHSLVASRHLHYCDIRSKLHNPSLWSWLSRLDDLRAAHIHSLTILPDGVYDINSKTLRGLRERLPPNFPSQTQSLSSLTLEATRKSQMLLVSALKRMSHLHQFRWYCVPVPVLEGEDDIWTTLARLGTIRELDIIDFEIGQFQVTPIAASHSFLRFRNFTTLKLETSICRSSPDPAIPQLEQMLLNNCINLEVLVLELDHFVEDETPANIDHLLKHAHWPRLRVLRFRGVNCGAPELERFLIAHPGIEELALAQLMPDDAWPGDAWPDDAWPDIIPGDAWTQLEIPREALPNLQHLDCSSSQAAALLKNSSTRPLKTLRYIEVHEQLHHWSDDSEAPPWRALFVECLKAQNSITHLGVSSIGIPEEMNLLADLAPQIKELEILSLSRLIWDTEWVELYSLFPALEIISGNVFCTVGSMFRPDTKLTIGKTTEANELIQTLARSCTKLRLIHAGVDKKISRKFVIIREGDEVKWVVRKWEESDDPYVKDGEIVYGDGPSELLCPESEQWPW